MSVGQGAFTRVEPHDGLFGFRLEFYDALAIPRAADRRIVLAVDVSNRLRPDAAAGERMAALIDAVMPTLIDHLAEEEWELLPIVSATLTQSEWDAKRVGRARQARHECDSAHAAAGHPRPPHRGNR